MKILLAALMGSLLAGSLTIAQEAAPVRLSEVEGLRLQIAALQQQVATVNGVLEGCRIELAHPGYVFDPAKGLVKKPATP